MTADPLAWTEHAICREDPEAFFPKKGGSTRKARRFCAECPVMPECFVWICQPSQRALEGVVAGMSFRERKKMYREIDTLVKEEGLTIVSAADRIVLSRRSDDDNE